MTTGNGNSDKYKDGGKKVTFEDQVTGGGKSSYNDMQDNGVYMQVRGHGLLMIRSCSLEEKDGSAVEIFVNVRNPSVPVTLIVPKDGDDMPEVFGDGDIQFTMKGADDVVLQKEFGNSVKAESKKADVELKEKSKNTHRRNNSDFLQVYGNPDCDVVDNSVPCVTLESDHNDDNKNRYDKNSVVNSVDLSILKSAMVKTDIDLGEDMVDSSINKLNKLSEETKQWSLENKVSNIGEDEYDIDLESEKIESDSEENPFSKRNDSLPYHRRKLKNRQLNFRRSVKSSNKEIWHEGKSLKSAIQHSFTYLLDVLDASELCDHLYENCLLDIVTYQDLYKLSSEHQYVRHAKRYLLMYLSTHTICHDKFVDSLYGSAQYQLIPLFYPGVNI